MLSGEYQHSLDAKGRIIMPSKLREDLGNTFVVTKGYDGCLFAYSMEEWERFEAKLGMLPESNANARRLVRMFESGATQCEVDKQGRLVLPSHLRSYAALEKEITVIGSLTKAEIWDTDKWNAYNNNESAISLEEAAASLEQFGL